MVEKDIFSSQIILLSESIEKNIFEIIAYFQGGNEHKGSVKFIDFTNIFQKLITFIGNNSDKINFKDMITSMNSLLYELMSAFQNENYVWVNDIFEYEFIPLIRKVKKSVS